ncbi:hypothetical protein VTN96DRAFT_5295 [Rasamsonia emersonii]
METIRDFNNIIHSQPFTFLVGPNHTQLTIQSALVKHVSKPLDHLMNNGETRESKVRIAVLEEEEVEVFVAFCEYAYTNDYTVPPGPQPDSPPQASDPWKHQAGGSQAGCVPPPAPSPPLEPTTPGDDSKIEGGAEDQGEEPAGDDGNAPAGQEDEGLTFGTEKKGKKKGKKDKKKSKGGVVFDEAANLTPPSTPPPEGKEDDGPKDETAEDAPKDDAAAQDIAVETDPGETEEWWNQQPAAGNDGAAEKKEEPRNVPVIDTSFAPQPLAPRRSKGGNPWDDFASLEYVHELPTQRDPTIKRPAPDPRVPYLLFHAKVYVFATRYLIPGLAQLCLKKLHRELLNLSLTPVSREEDEEEALKFEARAKMILDLLHYTYGRTARLEPVCQTEATMLRESELRKLVTQYAACKMKELAAYSPAAVGAPAFGLRELLDTTTELASDLIYRLMSSHL